MRGAAPANAVSSSQRPVLFVLFFLSGLCGLVYQVVWVRMAFASFGIITPVLSVVISVFMLGLSLGAWAGGRWIGPLVARTGLPAVIFYALAELGIGVGAFAVPKLFALGARLLLATGETNSVEYLFLSAVVLVLAVLPWCLFMGATFPLVMAHVREREGRGEDSFSYLYLANVLGAMSGTLLTALVLVEVFGFSDTLRVAAAGNLLIAGTALWLGLAGRGAPAPESPEPSAPTEAAASSRAALTPFATSALPAKQGRLAKGILFTTGFVSMAMEVVWMRAFAPVLKTQVYSFASIVAVYLGATFLGSLLYRHHLRRGQTRSTAELIGSLCVAALLPVLVNDARLMDPALRQSQPELLSALILLASICPFCAILGYLTPGLVDQYAAGSPKGAGAAYAVNVFGCILGPLFASYLLLPNLSEQHALVLLGLPFLGFHFYCSRSLAAKQRWGFAALGGAALAGSLCFSRSFEQQMLIFHRNAVIRRDYAASVVSSGEGHARYLAVNGVGMTFLTPITKFMAHLPLALHQGPPQSALVICFGMGTTFRSALSWNVETTAVELVPSVKDAFGFYHADAAQVLRNPKGRIVLDDGRRYLERTRGKYDLIIIDPPPPVEAAGSSLLYSTEFYEVAKRRLKRFGIVQAWVPANPAVTRAALRSLCSAFPHVRCFGSLEGWGMHLLASMEPILVLDAPILAARMPDRAKKDLLEWSEGQSAPSYLNLVLGRETAVASLLDPNVRIRITDDYPYNEYFLLRAVLGQ